MNRLVCGWALATVAALSSSMAGCASARLRLSELPCTDAIHANAADELPRLEAKAHADPRDRDALLCLAYAQTALKQFAQAKASATRALGVDPFDALALRIRAYANYRLGEYQAAIVDAERSIREGPIGESYEICGKSQMRMGRFTMAAKSFTQWVGADGSTEARCWLGAARWEGGDRVGAIREWDEAATLAPHDPEPWVWKCGFLYLAGDAKGAREAALHAQTLAPSSPQVLGAKARVEAWTGESAAAKQTLDALAQVDAASSARLTEALAQPVKPPTPPTTP
jgi:Flp pilus assembly protein TadD